MTEVTEETPAETTEEGGITYATGEPVPTTITSMFGLRVDPITGAANSGHTGIDIAPGGSPGVVNVIASKDGIVTKVNGENAQYTQELKNGDKVEIYWS